MKIVDPKKRSKNNAILPIGKRDKLHHILSTAKGKSAQAQSNKTGGVGRPKKRPVTLPTLPWN